MLTNLCCLCLQETGGSVQGGDSDPAERNCPERAELHTQQPVGHTVCLAAPLPPSPLYIRPPLLFLLHCMLLSLMYLLKRISEKSLIVTKLIKLDLVLIVLLTIVFGAAKCVCAEARECNRGNSLIKVALFKQR